MAITDKQTQIQYAQSITVENFSDKLQDWQIIGKAVYDRLSELFDRDFCPYDSSWLTIDFDYKEWNCEEWGNAVQLEFQGNEDWEVIYIN
jgi:hypothetical protein